LARTLLKEQTTDGILKQQLPKLIDSYKYCDGTHPASFITWSNDGSVPLQKSFNKICHYLVPECEPGYDHMLLGVPRSDEISLSYLRMLINGPYKSISDQVSLNEFQGAYYLHLSGLDKWPANMLFNFCIASRYPIEYGWKLGYWDTLVKEGYNPTLAFLLACTSGGAKLVGARIAPNDHVWFDTEASWSRIINGDPQHLSVSYKERPPACRPCNLIWSDGSNADFYKFSEMSEQDIAEYLGLPPSKPVEPTPVGPENVWYFTPAGNIRWGIPPKGAKLVHPNAIHEAPAPAWQPAPDHPWALPGWNDLGAQPVAPQPMHVFDFDDDDVVEDDDFEDEMFDEDDMDDDF